MKTARTLVRRSARLVVIVPFAALLCHPSPGFAVPIPILGNAQSFAVLGGASVSNTDSTVITGEVGVSPGTSITGFPPGGATSIHNNDGPAIAAQAAAAAALTGLANLVVPIPTNLTGQDLGSVGTLFPGIYKFTAAAALTGTLTLDAQGNSNAVWVFQIGSALTTAPGSVVQVTNTGGSNPADQGVFWVTGTAAKLGVGSTFEGNIFAGSDITLDPGAIIDCGRAFAPTPGTGAVTMAGLGGSPPLSNARNNAVSIGCADTEGFDSSANASGFSAGLQIDTDTGIVSFISGPGNGNGNGNGTHVPEPSTLLLLAAGLIGVAARMRRGRAW